MKHLIFCLLFGVLLGSCSKNKEIHFEGRWDCIEEPNVVFRISQFKDECFFSYGKEEFSINDWCGKIEFINDSVANVKDNNNEKLKFTFIKMTSWDENDARNSFALFADSVLVGTFWKGYVIGAEEKELEEAAKRAAYVIVKQHIK